jgi:hypothetical protein
MSFTTFHDMTRDEFQDISQQLYFLAIGNVCQCGEPKKRSIPLCPACCRIIGRPWVKWISNEVSLRRHHGRFAITALDWAIDYLQGRDRMKVSTETPLLSRKHVAPATPRSESLRRAI